MLRVETGGGFINPASTLNELPQFSLYGDGTSITPGVQIEIYPGPALSEPIATPLTEEGVQALLLAARGAGLFNDASYTDLGSVGIADAPTTTFTVNADGSTYTTTVYALGELSEKPAAMTDAEFEARAKLQAFVAKLGNLGSWLPQGSVGPDQPFEPQGLAIYSGDYQKDPTLHEPSIDWPLQPALADFGAAVPNLPDMRCGVASGSDLATLMPLARGANQLTPWVSASDRFGLTFRPLLPDQSTC